MNKIIRSLFILSLMTFTLISCEKAEPGKPGDGSGVIITPTNPGGGTQTGTSKINFKLDGVSRVGTDIEATYDKDLNMVVISCTTKNGSKTEGLSVLISEIKGAKTYSTTDDNLLATYITDITSDAKENLFIGASGSVVITAITDKVISGTFKFDAANEKSVIKRITEGTFSINLSASDSTDPGTTTPPTDPGTTTPTDPGTTTPITADVTFKIDGVSKKSDQTTTIYDASSKLLSITCLIFGAKTESVTIAIQNFTGAKTYTSGIMGSYNSDVAAGSLTTLFTATSGELVVSKIDSKSATGTFKFDAKSQANVTKKITEGKFTVDL